MKRKPVINLGVIGMGLSNMASTLALLKDAPDLRYRLRAVCSRRPEIVDQCVRQFGAEFGTTDYRELVERKDVDVVCVYSPDHLHADHCLAALAAGKHVVCTKPMVTSLADARKLVRLVRRTGRKFLVGQTMRFDRQFLMAKKMFDDGDLGNLIALESYYVHDMRPVFPFTPWRLNAPQDLMFGGCVHSIDVIRAFGGDVETVQANAIKGNLTKQYPMADNFFLNLKFKSGVIGRVSGLYGIVHPPTPMMQFGIYGTQGSLQAEFTDNEPGQVRVVLDKFPAKKPLVSVFEPERDLSAYGHGATVIRYMRHFQECLERDREPSPSVLDGAKSVAVGVAAWESVKTGKVIKAFNRF
ncbi:MAG: Gfo/Idh/MocA family oxidoreductase [Lentisphaerae bacterium]|nr:Gfo/Idh/MocA family oxidoreductase [Lentisphaerota bacterium]